MIQPPPIDPAEDRRRKRIVLLFLIALVLVFLAIALLNLQAAFVAVLVLGAAFDTWIVWRWGTDYTISWLSLQSSHEWPAIPFIAGLICGHVWLGQRGIK